MIGRTLGHYEIVEQLGTGGMGVVYKAKDILLDRFVAVKVLTAEAIADADRKRRFVQEAKAASALNHPNIVTIHEIACDDGVDYIVMEYVDGQTFDRVIGRGGMKLRDLLSYATQAADALAKAHAAGILHRDLKPSNLMVTNDGRVKILDFGLAKLTVSSVDSSGTTLLADPVRTGAGLVVGTPAYMSPEQAEGKPLDARSDIFSFGAVLYEMATGARAFRGDSTASTLAAILTSTPPPPSQAVPALPHELDRIIVRCLRKEPGRRFQFMADLAVELDEIRTESSEAIPAAQTSRSTRLWPWVAAAAGFAGIAAGAWTYWPGRTSSAPASITTLTTYRGLEWSPALSPDGTQVVFVWTGEQGDNPDIYLKPVDAVTPLRLTSHPAFDFSPVWSPSGREIAFVRAEANGPIGLYVTPPIPGSERKVTDVRGAGISNGLNPATNATPTWTPDGQSLVIAEAGENAGENVLSLIAIETGHRRTIASAPVTRMRYNRAAISPAGDAIAYVGCSIAGTTTCDLWLQRLGPALVADGTPKRLTDLRGAVSGETWMPDGRALIVSVTMSQFGFAHLWQVPIAGGEPSRLDWLGSPVHEPNMSRSGGRLVATRDTSDINLCQVDLTTPGGSLMVVHPLSSTLPDTDPDFSPNGEQIAFASARSGRETEIWIARRDGSGATPLTRGAAGRNRGSPRWSHDGKRMVYDSSSDDGVRRAYLVVATGGAPRLVSDYHANFPVWSPDDRWVYFASNRSGRTEIWRVLADGGAPEQVTRDGGTAPRITGGDVLYYRRGTTLYSRPLAGGAERAIVHNVTGISSAYLPVGNDVLYFARPDSAPSVMMELRAIDVKTLASRPLSRFEADNVSGLTVSPDGKTVLFAVFNNSSELILVDNFR